MGTSGDAGGRDRLCSRSPAGGLFGTGTAGNTHNGTSAESVYYQWAGVRNVLGYRELAVTATALPDGTTGVLAEAQSDWIVPRPTAERIPSSTGEIDITSGAPGRRPRESLSVSNRSQVGKIVRLINALPIAQPIIRDILSRLDFLGKVGLGLLQREPRLVTMTFRAAPGGPPLAVLTYSDFRPWSGPSQLCKTVALEIGGRTQDALIGGDFLKRIGRMLSRSLT